VAVSPLVLAVVFGLHFSLIWRSWIPISIAALLFVIGGYAQMRFIPLVVMSTREVLFHRLFLVVILGGLVGWTIYERSTRLLGL
jgi:hypothetical protein